MTIDTLEYVKKLEAAGVDRKAAEAQAEAPARSHRGRVGYKIGHRSPRGQARFQDFRAEIMKYMVAQTFVIAGIVFALLRFVR